MIAWFHARENKNSRTSTIGLNQILVFSNTFDRISVHKHLQLLHLVATLLPRLHWHHFGLQQLQNRLGRLVKFFVFSFLVCCGLGRMCEIGVFVHLVHQMGRIFKMSYFPYTLLDFSRIKQAQEMDKNSLSVWEVKRFAWVTLPFKINTHNQWVPLMGTWI